MNFLTILLIVIFFFGISESHRNKLTGIDVIETLRIKKISCDLKSFIKPSNNSEDDYQIFTHDLTKYCSISKSLTIYRLLCRMILIELEIGCLLPRDSRSASILYSIPHTSIEICSMNKISLTNSWIWQKLTSDEKEEIGPTSLNLCPVLTSLNSTLRLARFFYKIAPKIRKADLSATGSVDKNHSGNSVFNKIQVVGETSLDKMNNTNSGLFEPQNKLSGTKHTKLLNQTENQINPVLDLKQGQSKSNKTNNMKKSVNHDEELNSDQKEQNLHGRDSKKVGEIEQNPSHPVKKNEEGLPLGRAGENPEREQVNERPKPKILDVETVFKSNDDEEQNWVEGKHNADQPENGVDHLSLLKFGNEQFIVSQSGKRRNSHKLKLNKRLNDNGRHLSNHLITTFLVFILCIIVIYLILRHKNKVLGLVIELCQRKRIASQRRLRLSQSS